MLYADVLVKPGWSHQGMTKKSRRGDRTNKQWVADLQSSGETQFQALADLRDYLLRAVYVYLSRQRSDLAHLDRSELEQLAEDCAQEALVLILKKLHTFRGDSKFTTWAYRVIINVAAGKLRRRRWKDVSLEALADEEDEEFSLLDALQDTHAEAPEKRAQQREVLEALQKIIREELTERQRIVLTGLILQDVPTEVLAEQLNTNRNNIYKILHDGRKKLKHRLEERGLSAEYMLSVFNDFAG